MSRVPFEWFAHLVTVPVSAGAVPARFVLDTGIGPTIVSERVAARTDARDAGRSFTGRRMSGQEVAVPLATIPALELGTLRRERLLVGVLDLPGLDGVDGFLSLEFFRQTPFTVDYADGAVCVETPKTLAARVATGTPVELRLEDEGCSLDASLDLTLPNGREISVEVDMGSDSLILDTAFAPELDVDLDADNVRKVDGVDETGYAYTRSFTMLSGTIHLAGAPTLAQADPTVMFQRIIYEGLLGNAFLRDFTVTYDMPGSRAIFAPPTEAAS